MLSRRLRENFPKRSKLASLKRDFNCVSFQCPFLEKCPFFKLYLVYNSLVLVFVYKSIIIQSDFE